MRVFLAIGSFARLLLFFVVFAEPPPGGPRNRRYAFDGALPFRDGWSDRAHGAGCYVEVVSRGQPVVLPRSSCGSEPVQVQVADKKRDRLLRISGVCWAKTPHRGRGKKIAHVQTRQLRSNPTLIPRRLEKTRTGGWTKQAERKEFLTERTGGRGKGKNRRGSDLRYLCCLRYGFFFCCALTVGSTKSMEGKRPGPP